MEKSVRRGILLAGLLLGSRLPAQQVQFVFTSDAHYGLTRPRFRGGRDVAAQRVNAALVAGLNTLPGLVLPQDGGVRAGQRVGPIDFVVEGGDIATKGTQSPAVSWAQFETDYIEGLQVQDGAGRRAPLCLIPGNHDALNATGDPRHKHRAADATVMVEILNRMQAPVPRKTAATYRYAADPIHYSRDFQGLHAVFISLWPEASVRAWLEQDLKTLGPETPVLLFAHDPPVLPLEQLTGPEDHPEGFENLLAERPFPGESAGPGTRAQRALTEFLRAHRNLTAWFHGHANWQEAYAWTGTDGTLGLHVFRVDSPMKGRQSAQDETRLSFQLASVDLASRRMTVRECLWNTGAQQPVRFGASTTVSLGASAP